MRLFITRHGQPVLPAENIPGEDPDYPPGDPHLSTLGREQARRLGLRLQEEASIKTIFASPYRRTMETANVIAEILGVKIVPEPAFREYTGPHIHTFRGSTLEALRTSYSHLHPEASLSFPWWTLTEELPDETGFRPAIYARVKGLIDRLRATPPGDVLLVGHGATVGAALSYLRDSAPKGSTVPASQPNWNCALSSAQLLPEISISYISDTQHLNENQVTSNRLTSDEVLAAAKA